jgi:hypothetical protein
MQLLSNVPKLHATSKTPALAARPMARATRLIWATVPVVHGSTMQLPSNAPQLHAMPVTHTFAARPKQHATVSMSQAVKLGFWWTKHINTPVPLGSATQRTMPTIAARLPALAAVI